MRLVAIVIALVIAAGVRADEPADSSATSLIDFTVEDQFDVEHTRAEFAGHVVLLLWTDRGGSDHLDRWDRTLRRKLKRELESDELMMRIVAHVKGVPGFVKGAVRDRFGDDAEGWALMDWKGVFADAYPVVEDHCNLLVFGRDGSLLAHEAVSGLEQGAFDAVLTAVERGLAAGDAPPDRGDAPAPADQD